MERCAVYETVMFHLSKFYVKSACLKSGHISWTNIVMLRSVGHKPSLFSIPVPMKICRVRITKVAIIADF